MKRTRSKKRNNYIHFKRRIRERYGISVNRVEYKELRNQVRNKGIFLGRQRANRTVYQVNLRGMKIIVVYDNRAGNIVTTLYPGRSYRLV